MLTMVTVQRTEPHGMGQKLLEILRPAKVVEQIKPAQAENTGTLQ